jgi:hypothetical protein
LVITESGAEVLVYDVNRHQIHHLNEVSAVVWRLLDGRRTLADVASAAQRQLGTEVSKETVLQAVAKLAGANLLDGAPASDWSPPAQSRRAFLRKAGVAGAIAVPAIVSITAPAFAGAGFSICRIGAQQWPEACELGGASAQAGDCCCDDWNNPADPGCGICGCTQGHTCPPDKLECIGAN